MKPDMSTHSQRPIQQTFLRAVFLLCLLLPAVGLPAAKPPTGVITITNRQAPALVLKDIDGQAYDLSTHRGSWVFVHFWASWCGPCRRELPTIQTFQKQMEGSGLGIILVNTAETEDEVFNFQGLVAPDLRTLLDRDGKVTEVWQPRGLPATFLVDPKGHIRYLALGGRDWASAEYQNFIRQVISEK